MIQKIDVKPDGIGGTDIGFSAINEWFHKLTGVHMGIYTITDWLGLIAIFVCMGFGILGLYQWLKRRKILKVDFDIRVLGGYYIVVIFEYLIFEMIPINYRPIYIDGRMEASYPSSTTLLVLSVMPTLVFELRRRMKKGLLKEVLIFLTVVFSLFMVIGRTIAGVHWMTDIVGAILLSTGSYLTYKAVVCCMMRGDYLEFYEKLQELRKSRKLTQEELAEALYVSRTAISKWESGRGYPSIDSLKAIAGFFSVSIDELLSADTLVSIAEKENKSNIQRVYNLLFGVIDLMSILLALLPLYSRQMDGFVTAVNLWNFNPTNKWLSIICWLLIIALLVLGIVKIGLNHIYSKKRTIYDYGWFYID